MSFAYNNPNMTIDQSAQFAVDPRLMNSVVARERAVRVKCQAWGRL